MVKFSLPAIFKSSKSKSDNQEITGMPDKYPVQAMKQTPHDLVAVAINQGSDLTIIEKLMDLRDRWEAGEAKKAYTHAITHFKAECPEIFKDKTVKYDHKKGEGKTKYDYESLPNILKTITPAMSKYGLSVSWKLDESDNQIKVTCFITHEFGHFESTALSGPPDNSGNKNTIQAKASTISFLERYTLKSILGLASHDDDGRTSEPETKVKADMISTAQLKQINKLKKELDLTDEKFSTGINELFQISNVSDLSRKQADESINMLKAKISYRNERNAKNNQG